MKKTKKIKEKDLDKLFSKYIREKNNYTCERCKVHVEPPTNYIQCSHFHSRVARSVRFNEDNADCLCAGCHRFFETRKTVEYRDWKRKKLGTRRFNELERAYHKAKAGGFTEEEKQKIIDKYATK